MSFEEKVTALVADGGLTTANYAALASELELKRNGEKLSNGEKEEILTHLVLDIGNNNTEEQITAKLISWFKGLDENEVRSAINLLKNNGFDSQFISNNAKKFDQIIREFELKRDIQQLQDAGGSLDEINISIERLVKKLEITPAEVHSILNAIANPEKALSPELEPIKNEFLDAGITAEMVKTYNAALEALIEKSVADPIATLKNADATVAEKVAALTALTELDTDSLNGGQKLRISALTKKPEELGSVIAGESLIEGLVNSAKFMTSMRGRWTPSALSGRKTKVFKAARKAARVLEEKVHSWDSEQDAVDSEQDAVDSELVKLAGLMNRFSLESLEDQGYTLEEIKVCKEGIATLLSSKIEKVTLEGLNQFIDDDLGDVLEGKVKASAVFEPLVKAFSEKTIDIKVTDEFYWDREAYLVESPIHEFSTRDYLSERIPALKALLNLKSISLDDAKKQSELKTKLADLLADTTMGVFWDEVEGDLEDAEVKQFIGSLDGETPAEKQENVLKHLQKLAGVEVEKSTKSQLKRTVGDLSRFAVFISSFELGEVVVDENTKLEDFLKEYIESKGEKCNEEIVKFVAGRLNALKMEKSTTALDKEIKSSSSMRDVFEFLDASKRTGSAAELLDEIITSAIDVKGNTVVEQVIELTPLGKFTAFLAEKAGLGSINEDMTLEDFFKAYVANKQSFANGEDVASDVGGQFALVVKDSCTEYLNHDATVKDLFNLLNTKNHGLDINGDGHYGEYVVSAADIAITMSESKEAEKLGKDYESLVLKYKAEILSLKMTEEDYVTDFQDFKGFVEQHNLSLQDSEKYTEGEVNFFVNKYEAISLQKVATMEEEKSEVSVNEKTTKDLIAQYKLTDRSDTVKTFKSFLIEQGFKDQDLTSKLKEAKSLTKSTAENTKNGTADEGICSSITWRDQHPRTEGSWDEHFKAEDKSGQGKYFSHG